MPRWALSISSSNPQQDISCRRLLGACLLDDFYLALRVIRLFVLRAHRRIEMLHSRRRRLMGVHQDVIRLREELQIHLALYRQPVLAHPVHPRLVLTPGSVSASPSPSTVPKQLVSATISDYHLRF